VSCAHQLDPIGDEASESSRDGGGSVEGGDSFSLTLARIGR
jgi:hypothetical protein